MGFTDILKLIAQFGLGVLGGGAVGGSGSVGSSAASGGYRGGSGSPMTSNSGKGSWSDFIYPVSTVGGVFANNNSAGTARAADYAHGRTEAEHAAIIKKYEDQFKQAELPRIARMKAGAARAQAMTTLDNRARQYAVQMSQQEHSYLPFEYMNTPADVTTHTQPIASSSWVGNIRRISPTEVEVNLNGRPYTYGGTPEEVERFLNSPSLGREITNIKKGMSNSLRRLNY